jgi:hypothetical protein
MSDNILEVKTNKLVALVSYKCVGCKRMYDSSFDKFNSKNIIVGYLNPNIGHWICNDCIKGTDFDDNELKFDSQNSNHMVIPLYDDETDNIATVEMFKYFLSKIPDNWEIRVYDGRYDLISAHNPENINDARHFHVTDIDRYIFSKTGHIELNEDRSG